MMEAIIDICIKKAMTLHDILHGFHVEREIGASIMKLKLAHELVRVEQDPLLLVLLNLRN